MEKIEQGYTMAQFSGERPADAGGANAGPIKSTAPNADAERKWKPGGRGRPPKSAKPPADDEPDLLDNDVEMGEHNQPPPKSEIDLRRNAGTYPRRENGLPIPLYRVTRTEDDLHNFLSAMRPEDWGHCELYIYKYYPRAKSVQGQPTYIDKVGQGPVDLLALMETHGSGVYGFTLNDANVQGNRRTVMYAKVELRRDHIPEMWDLETLDIDHKDNKQLVARLVRDGVITTKGERVAQVDSSTGMAQVIDKLTNALLKQTENGAKAPPPVPDANAAAMAAVNAKTIDMLGAANKAAIDAATAGNRSGGVAETLQLVNAIVGAMKPADNTQMMGLLLETMRTTREETKAANEAAERERQRNHELQMAALAQKQQAADPFAQVEQIMKIKNLFTGGGPERPLGWREQGIQMLGDHLPQILEVGGALVRNIGRPNPVNVAQLPGAGAGGGPGGPQGGQAGQVPQLPGADGQGSQQQQMPQSPTAAEQQTVPMTGPDGQPLTPQQRQQIARIQQLQSQIQQNGRFLVNAISRGQDGYTFAESLINMTDDLTYQRARGYSVDEWMTAIFSFPELAQQFSGVEMTVKLFVEQFIEYGEPELETDDETTDQSQPQPGAAAASPARTPTLPATTSTTRKKKGKE